MFYGILQEKTSGSILVIKYVLLFSGKFSAVHSTWARKGWIVSSNDLKSGCVLQMWRLIWRVEPLCFMVSEPSLPSNLWCLILISVCYRLCYIWGVWNTNNQWFFGSENFHKIGTNVSSSSETFRNLNWQFLTKSNTHPTSVVWVPPLKRKHGPRSHIFNIGKTSR